MTKLMKLSVIALLTGTLALVGCGDDETNGTGATGGEGATGGSGGSGGSGGGLACEQDCGEGNELPTGAEEATATGNLTCSLEEATGVALNATFQIVLVGVLTDGTPIEIGDNSVDLGADSIVSAATSALIFNFAPDGSDIEGIATVVRPILGALTPEDTTIELVDVPCTVCWSPAPGVANSIVLDTVNAVYAFPGDEGDTLSLQAQDATLTVNVEGVGSLALTTTGDMPDCFWGTIDDSMPPVVTPEEAPSISFPGPQ